MDVPTNAPLAIPEGLLAEINAAADEACRPPGELVQEAIQRYVDERAWKKIFAYGEAQAKALGLTEEDVPRLIAESRREHRQGTA
jgi:hypothetical protein